LFILNFEADVRHFLFLAHAEVCANFFLAQTQHAFKIDFLAQAQRALIVFWHILSVLIYAFRNLEIFSFMLSVH
jgi:hypothetical protein